MKKKKKKIDYIMRLAYIFSLFIILLGRQIQTFFGDKDTNEPQPTIILSNNIELLEVLCM